MKSYAKYIGVMAAGLFLWQGVAAAEMVQGQVTAASPENRSLTIQRIEEEGKMKEIKLSIPEQAELRGLSSIQDVEVGDEVRAEANKPALGFGSWEVRWIEKAAGSSVAAMNSGDQADLAPESEQTFGTEESAGSASREAGQTSY